MTKLTMSKVSNFGKKLQFDWSKVFDNFWQNDILVKSILPWAEFQILLAKSVFFNFEKFEF